MEFDRAAGAFAARQHGVVTRRQLIEAGVPPNVVARRVSKRSVRPLHAGVYLVGPIPSQWTAEMAACLALGPSAAVARRSAAAYWGFAPPRHEPAEVEMLVVGATRRRPGLRIQRTDRVQSDEIVAPVGFPITSPGRTLLDLAHSEPAIRLGRWLAAAVAKGTVSRAAIGRLLDRYSGCRGTTRLREVLESEPEFTRSEAERVFLGLVSAAQLPPPEVNVRLGSFEVDFYWPEHRVVVEIDGYRFHGSRSSFEQDRARDAALVARGLRVMRATWRQLTRERDVVLVRLAQTLGPG